MTAQTCAALSARHLIKGATLADQWSRIGGALSRGLSIRKGLGGGHVTGMLRVEAVTRRRSVKSIGRAWL